MAARVIKDRAGDGDDDRNGDGDDVDSTTNGDSVNSTRAKATLLCKE